MCIKFIMNIFANIQLIIKKLKAILILNRNIYNNILIIIAFNLI